MAPNVPGIKFRVSVLPRPEPGWHQLAINGCRVYTFTGDHHPGDTFGHGMVNILGGQQIIWHAFALHENTPSRVLPIKLVAIPPENLPKNTTTQCR